jgi:hypothetical protein
MKHDSALAALAKSGFIPANHQEANWFDVGVGPVHDPEGNIIDGLQRIFREDTKKTIKVHTNAYKLITYEESFSAFDAALNSSGLDITDMMVSTDLTHDGGRCFRQYVLPKHLIDMGDGDLLALRIIMFNSYDGSMAFRGMAGAYRFVCANTCVIGKHIIKVNVKHTKNAEILPAIDTIVNSAQVFTEMEPRLLAMKEAHPTEAQAYNFLRLTGAQDTAINQLFVDWSLGDDASLYGLFNAATSWSSHGSADKITIAGRCDREDQVASMVFSQPWEKLESLPVL